MSINKLKIQVGRKAFTEIITYCKDNQKYGFHISYYLVQNEF